jgi:hypothetical protein
MEVGTRVILSVEALAAAIPGAAAPFVRVPLAGRIIAPYTSPFGPSWLVELDRGDTMAVRVAGLREEPAEESDTVRARRICADSQEAVAQVDKLPRRLDALEAPALALCAHCIREDVVGGYMSTDEDTWRPKAAGERCEADDCGWYSYPEVDSLARRVAFTVANMAAEDGGAAVRLDAEQPTRDQLVAWVAWYDRNADVHDLTRLDMIELVVNEVRDSLEGVAVSL